MGKSDYYERIANATDNIGGVYFLPGKYCVIIDSVFWKKSWREVDFSIIETTVVHSVPADLDPELLKPGESWPQPGDKRSVASDMSQTLSDGNLKNFLKAVALTLYDEMDALKYSNTREFAKSVYEEGAADGIALFLFAFHKAKKKSEGLYTRLSWEPYTGQLGPLPGQEEGTPEAAE